MQAALWAGSKHRQALQGDAARAEQHYRRAIAQDASLNAGYLGLAELLVATGRDDDAVRALRDGLRHAASPGALHFALGLIAGGRRQWSEAARELEAAASLLPNDARVRRNLDIVRERLRQQSAR